MRLIFFTLTACCILSAPLRLSAQTSNNFLGWLAVIGTVKLDNKYSLHIEGDLRSTNEWQQIQTILFRTALNYKISSNQTVSLGYAYVSNARAINGINGFFPEDRIYEQYSNYKYFSIHNHYISLRNRLRLEQRFIGQTVVENNQLENDGFSFVQRFRYFIRAVVPFTQSPKKDFLKGSYFALQNEIFVNIGNVSVVNGKFFDQNRAYFAFGYRFSPKNDTEIGYIYQFISEKGTSKANNSIIQLATYFQL